VLAFTGIIACRHSPKSEETARPKMELWKAWIHRHEVSPINLVGASNNNNNSSGSGNANNGSSLNQQTDQAMFAFVPARHRSISIAFASPRNYCDLWHISSVVATAAALFPCHDILMWVDSV
jgi:hypothetical protein